MPTRAKRPAAKKAPAKKTLVRKPAAKKAPAKKAPAKSTAVKSVAAALEITLAADPFYAEPINAALVSFCRSLAAQISEAERAGGRASTHVQAAYLSAMKDLNRGRGKQTKKGAGRGSSNGVAAPTGLAGIRGAVAGVSTSAPRKRSA